MLESKSGDCSSAVLNKTEIREGLALLGCGIVPKLQRDPECDRLK